MSGEADDAAQSDALQTTLAAEHAAVEVLAYLGAQTSRSAQPDLAEQIETTYLAHRDQRDALAALLRTAGAEPVAAEAAYQLPEIDGSADSVRRAALAVERACGRTYAFLVSSSRDEARRAAVGLAVTSAVREIGLGGRPASFPGT